MASLMPVTGEPAHFTAGPFRPIFLPKIPKIDSVNISFMIYFTKYFGNCPQSFEKQSIA